MNVLEALYDEVNTIKNDELSGSTEIALKALDIVTAAIDLDHYENEYFPMAIADLLRKAKPAMAAVNVICNYAVNDYIRSIGKNKKYFCQHVRNKMLIAGEKTILKAYETLFNNNLNNSFNISTCSYSSNIVKLLRFAEKSGKKIKLNILESVWNNNNYSEQLALELNSPAIVTNIVTIEKFLELKHSLDFCLIGADGYDYDNNVVNGIPSLELAKAADMLNSFYVVAESFKKVKNLKTDDGFEFIPAKYITDIISDDEKWFNEEDS
jgi:translation initiation factor 2B subunit (eIF-2B alpha/beta/delta family)